jgi:hypothetical protein
MTAFEKSLECYRRGIITQLQLMYAAVDAANDMDPALCAGAIPIECVEQIRGLTIDIPPLDKVLFIFGGVMSRDADYAAFEQKQKELYVGGLARWRDYFAHADAVSVAPPGLPENG